MNARAKPQTNVRRQRGFNLIELLVATAVGLFVLAAVTSIFVTIVGSNNDNLKAVRLNQELRAVMGLIVRDLRRAGANGVVVNPGASGMDSPNPFSETGTTRMVVANNQQGTANSCVTYAYDSNKDGIVDASEYYGFRLDGANGAVETRTAGAACDASGWEDLTDSNVVQITGLTFTETSYCSDVTYATQDTCIGAGMIYIRQVSIVLSGRLRRDTSVARTINETIRIRNDEYTI